MFTIIIMTSNEDYQFGWYSQTQKKLFEEYNNREKSNIKDYCSFIYLNNEGKEVEVTEVTSNDKFKSYFKDAIYVGIITKFVRHNLIKK